jgi:hypothetical protein
MVLCCHVPAVLIVSVLGQVAPYRVTTSFHSLMMERGDTKSRDSSVSIPTGYKLDGWDSILWSGKTFHNVQTGSGAHPATCPMDTVGSFPGGKTAGT